MDVYDDAMAQYEYKGVKLSYKHKKISSGMCLCKQKAITMLLAIFQLKRSATKTDDLIIDCS